MFCFGWAGASVDYHRDFGYIIIRLLLSKAMLCKLCKAEKIRCIVKGQYVLLEDMQLETMR